MPESQPSVFQDPDLDPALPNRSLAASARELAKDPAFQIACSNLVKEYMRRFCALSPFNSNGSANPHYEQQCVRAQLALNVVPDVCTQLQMMADHFKVEDAAINKTLRGGK